MTPANRKPTPKPEQQENEWLEWIKTLGLVLVLSFGIRTFIAQAFHIPSESMEPTLEVGDRLIVYKLSYMSGPPQRGDIVVFRAPETAQNQCRVPASDFIKRIVALPGDEIEVISGQVFLNGDLLEESYIDEAPTYDMETTTIPDESVLVLGDNRNNSCDGHLWGELPTDLILGRAVFRYWPPGRMSGL